MKEFIAEILFLEEGKRWVNFPIKNGLRLSFWLLGDKVSTPSEIELLNENIEIGKSTLIKMRIIEREFLTGRIETGTEFRIGTFPDEVAQGKVIEVIS